ncbi:zinc-dependent peptidase, partial [Myxococcota bacterium]|nr:zinc-dependent peptidase [Myxococcota bacterium]
MLRLVLVAGVVVTVFIVWMVHRAIKKARHQKLMVKPFPPEWEAILHSHFPLYDRLSPELQKELRGKVHIFLDEKNFEGAGGLELTDEIRVSIAAQACFLLLNRQAEVYPGLVTVVVYPSTYKHADRIIPGVVGDGGATVAGESWGTDLVVLAWNQVEKGAKNIHDGHNVVFHEFAHQLDAANGDTDGVPVLEKGSSHDMWAMVCQEEFNSLVDNLSNHKKLVMDRYGATNP